MAAQDRYPGAGADVAYNVQPSDPMFNDMPIAVAPFLFKSQVPLITHRELSAIQRRVFDEIYRFMDDSNVPLFDEVLHDEIFGADSVRVDRGDRTVEIAIRPYPLLSINFIRMLQRDILQRFPLWRVAIGTLDKFVLYVYPDELKIWPPLPVLPKVDQLETWRIEVERRFSMIEGDQRRQFALSRALVPLAMAEWPDGNRCRLLSCFGSHDGNNLEWSLWFLVNGEIPSEVIFDEREDISTGRSYPVNSDGTLGRFIVWVYDGNGDHIRKVNEFNSWLQQVIVHAKITDLTILRTADRQPIQKITIQHDAIFPAWDTSE